MLQQSGGLCHRHRTRPGRSTPGSGQAGQRRAQATHSARARPELVPTRPGQVWSWTSPSCAAPTEGSTTTCTWCSTSSPGSWSPGRSRAPPLRDRPAQPGTGALRHRRRGPAQPAADPGRRRRHTTHPERFGHRRPQAPKSPTVAWIIQPSQEALIQPAYRDVSQPACTFRFHEDAAPPCSGGASHRLRNTATEHPGFRQSQRNLTPVLLLPGRRLLQLHRHEACRRGDGKRADDDGERGRDADLG